MNSLLLHPALWAAASFLAVFMIAGFWLLSRPRKWWVLTASAIAAFVLFGPFGLAGFLAALSHRVWKAAVEAGNKKKQAGKTQREKKEKPTLELAL